MNSEVASTESTSIDESQALVQSTVQVAMDHDAAFVTTWLHGKSEKTRRAYEGDIRKFYAPVGKPLAEVQLVDVQAFIDSLAPLKVSSQARAVAALKSCLSFAVKTGYLQFNVGAVLKLPKSENTLAERIMSEQAVARMLAKEENQRNHAILVLLYRAGLRAQDVSAYSGGTFSRVIIVVRLRSMAKGRRHASCCSIREYGTNYRRCGQPVSILMPMFSNHGNRELAQAKRTANLTPA